MREEIELPEQLPGYRWVVINLWFLCASTASMLNFGVGILLPSISQDLNLSPSQQGLLASAAFWAGLFLAIPATWLLSRFRAKLLGIVALALAGLFLTLQGWAATFGVLFVGRLGFGLAGLFRSPAQSLLINQWFHRREFLLVQGISNTFWGIFVGGGMLVTPYILSGFENNWGSVLHTYAAAFGVLTFIWLLFGSERVLRRDPKGPAPRTPGVSVRVLANRDLLLNGLGTFGSILTMSAFFTFLPTLMLNTYDISLKWSGAALGIGTVIGGFTGAGVSFVATAIGRRNQMLQALGVLMVGTYVGLSLADTVPLLMILAIVNGIAWGCWPIVGTVPFILPGLKPREIAVAVAINSTMFAIGNVSGPIVTGFLQEATDLKTSLFIVSFGALLLTVAGTFLRVGRADPPSPQSATSGPGNPTERQEP